MCSSDLGTDLHIIGEVAGSPDGLPISQVEKKALAAVAAGHASAAESLFENDREADRIAPLIDVRQICDAAIEGRVHRLYVRVATQFLGRLDPAVTSVTGDEDLISAAVASALRTGGDVIPVPAKSMNLGTPLAAVLRY